MTPGGERQGRPAMPVQTIREPELLGVALASRAAGDFRFVLLKFRTVRTKSQNSCSPWLASMATRLAEPPSKWHQSGGFLQRDCAAGLRM